MAIRKKSNAFLIMEESDKMSKQKGTLYLVSTPIGNLSDMTFRAVETLKQVDKIYAEDTRTSYTLLNHYGIETPSQSYHKYNENTRVNSIINELKDGQNIALISDAGTPLISDPGENLVKAAINEDIIVTHIPGPTALISGLILSGKPTHPFLFYGFLPSKNAERDKIIETLKYYPYTLIFYEAPHRIKTTLKAFKDIFITRDFSIIKEITKYYETSFHYSLEEIDKVPDLKGEIVLVLEGYHDKKVFNEEDLIQHIILNIEDGLPEMDAIKKVAKERKMKKNDVYMAFQKHKSNQRSA